MGQEGGMKKLQHLGISADRGPMTNRKGVA